MSDIPFSTFKMLLGRMRQAVKATWKDFTYRIFGHTNPEYQRGWVYKTFMEDKPNYRLVSAPTTQNIYLPEGFCDELKNYMMKNIIEFLCSRKTASTIRDL